MPAVTARLAAAVAVVTAIAGCGEPYSVDTTGAVSSFPLGGRHLELPCTDCHLSTPFTSLVWRACEQAVAAIADPCLDCHGCERPQGHFDGSCGADGGCHSPFDLRWEDALGGGTITDPGQACDRGCHGVPVGPDAAPSGDAHPAHLGGDTLWSRTLGCDDCHPPGAALAPTHDDGVNDVVLAGPALGPAGDLSPSYTAGTCAGTYCHGGAMEVPAAAPGWDDGPDAVACGTCHGWPPAGTHTPLTACGACHAPTGGDGQVLGDLDSHIDGALDLSIR